MDVQRRERFGALYRATRAALLAYALRRALSPDDAADVVAETYAIAWRRFEHVPAGDDALLWLYGTARNVLRNESRRRRRRSELVERIAGTLPESTLAPDGAGLEALLSLRSLPDDDREVLMLTAWEGLRPAQVARVLGCSSGAARIRLHRARRRLESALSSLGVFAEPFEQVRRSRRP